MIDRFKTPKWWSKHIYYIFAPDYHFDGKIKDASDFVLKVRINCYWVLAAPGMPYLFKCKTKENPSNVHYRKDHEIFNTPEEVLAVAEKGFIDHWIELTRRNLTSNIEYSKWSMVREKKNFKLRTKQLETFDKLLSEANAGQNYSVKPL